MKILANTIPGLSEADADILIWEIDMWKYWKHHPKSKVLSREKWGKNPQKSAMKSSKKSAQTKKC